MQDDDDDFVDILPARLAGKVMPQLLVRIVALRAAQRVQFNFAPEILGEIQGPRFDIQWAAKTRRFRILARDLGRYEALQAGRSPRQMLRCPLPPGLEPADTVLDPEFYVDREAKTIVVEIGGAFAPRALPAPAPIVTTVSAARELVAKAKAAVPAPSFSSHSGGGVAELDQKVVRAALGLTGPRAFDLGGQHFTPTEGAIVDLLARRARVTREAVLMATADPVGDDDRGEKIADVLVCRIRPKMEALRFAVLTHWGEGWYLALDDRKRLKAMLAAEREAAA